MYHIQAYQPSYKEQVIQLLALLWEMPLSSAQRKFDLKYYCNPYDNEVYAVMALLDQQVVGFRGFIPTRWEVDHKSCWILLVADAFVQKEHRRQGLFTSMTHKAIDAFAESKYTYFLNLSSNQKSYHGNVKLGWAVLAEKSYHRFTSIKNLLCLLMGVRLQSNPPMPEYISRTEHLSYSGSGVRRPKTPHAITLSEPQEHFKYKALRHHMVELSYKEDGKVMATLWIYDKGSVCTIEDFCFTDVTYFNKIIRYLKKEYHVVSAWRIALECQDLRKSILSRCIRGIEKNKKAPFLIRPIKKDWEAKDCVIGKVDLLRKENWCLRNILEE